MALIEIPKEDVDYKEIVIEGDYKSEDLSLFSSSINKSFSYKDIKVVLSDVLTIMVNSIDIDKYNSIVDGLSIDIELKRIVKERVNTLSYVSRKGKRYFLDGIFDSSKSEEVKSLGKYYYAIDNTFTKEVNDIPKEYENKIICNDSLIILKDLPDNCIDIIVTSPPYNFGMEYNEYNDISLWDKYFNELFIIFDECIRVLKFGGRFIINVQPCWSEFVPTHHIISNHLMNKKMIWKGEIIWEKNNFNCKSCSWGSWKSPSMPYLKYTWEYIEVFCKGDLKKEGDSSNIDITANEFKSWVVSKWNIPPERRMKDYEHPAMFPEELVERSLKLFSYQNDIVLDPFNGVGTTTYVARKLKRRFLGIDISEEYCKKAKDRLIIR